MLPMHASADGPIKVSPDGQSVIMPVSVFRARETDLLKQEELIEVLKRQITEERTLMKDLREKMYSLEVAIESERKAAAAIMKAIEWQVVSERWKAGSIGFFLGGIAGYAIR